MPNLLSQLPPPPPDKTGWPWTEATDPELFTGRNDWPRISIITPSYNQGQFIEETIRSVLLQNYPNLEYIIIDGGSTDESVQIIEKYAPWITYWVSEPDRGQSHAINKGVERSSGKWLNWLNSDDLFLKNAFWNVLNGTNLVHKEVVSSLGLITNENLDPISVKIPFIFDFDEMISWGKTPTQPAVFFTRKVYEKVGGVKEDLHYTMDWRLWLDIAYHFTPESQALNLGFVTSVSRLWSDIKSFNGTFDEGYKEILSTVEFYSEQGVKISEATYRRIYDRRKVFARLSKQKTIWFYIEGFKKFKKIYYIKGLIMTILFFKPDNLFKTDR